MQINNIKRQTKKKTSKDVGRGGQRGKTSGRGTKGQNARSGRKFRPAIRDAIKKLPKLRGYTFNSHIPKNVAINLSVIEKVASAGDVINVNFLVEKGLLHKEMGKIPRVKVLGTGEFTKKVKFEGLTVSAKAKEAIEKAGGTC